MKKATGKADLTVTLPKSPSQEKLSGRSESDGAGLSTENFGEGYIKVAVRLRPVVELIGCMTTDR